jgi:hypothetical protein
MRELSLYAWVALIVVLIGGVCWGFVGLFNVHIITGLFGHLFGRLIYIVVGLAAGYLGYLIYLDKFKKVS